MLTESGPRPANRAGMPDTMKPCSASSHSETGRALWSDLPPATSHKDSALQGMHVEVLRDILAGATPLEGHARLTEASRKLAGNEYKRNSKR